MKTNSIWIENMEVFKGKEGIQLTGLSRITIRLLEGREIFPVANLALLKELSEMILKRIERFRLLPERE